jgi:hypothetical protein
MKNGALVIVMILGALGNAFYDPAFAQSSVGGPKKQNVVGGPVTQSSAVLPPNKGGSIPASPSLHSKCSVGACAGKETRR